MFRGRNIFRVSKIWIHDPRKSIYSFNYHFLKKIQSFMKFREDGHEFIILCYD